MAGLKCALLALELIPGVKNLEEKELERKVVLTHVQDNPGFTEAYAQLDAQINKIDQQEEMEDFEGDALTRDKYSELRGELCQQLDLLVEQTKFAYTACSRLDDGWQIITVEVVERWEDENFHRHYSDMQDQEAKDEVVLVDKRVKDLADVQEYIKQLGEIFEVCYRYPVGTRPNRLVKGGQREVYFGGTLYCQFPWQS